MYIKNRSGSAYLFVEVSPFSGSHYMQDMALIEIIDQSAF